MSVQVESIKYKDVTGFKPGTLYCMSGSLRGQLCEKCKDNKSCKYKKDKTYTNTV